MQYALKYYRYYQYKDDFALFQIVEQHVNQSLTGARVLDVAISPNSKEKVNYAYDKLYDVDISYERDGKIKHIVAQYGIYRGTWISPNTIELEILDDNAKTIHKKHSGEN